MVYQFWFYLRPGITVFSRPVTFFAGRLLALCFLATLLTSRVDAGDALLTLNPTNSEAFAKSDPLQPQSTNEPNWSLQFGVAFISANDVHEVLGGAFNIEHGDSGGQLYEFMVNWTAHRFRIRCGDSLLTPTFEPYFTLTLVDQNDGEFFPDYNGGIGFRWVNFPWDKFLDTGMFMGVGLSYSTQIYAMDEERHPGEDRSHLKIDWPIQFTFALPRWPQHQAVLFIDHQSGGHIFDEGGVNSVGFGYRYEF